MTLIRTVLPRYVKVLMAILAVIGLAGVLPVSLAEIRSTATCPHLGPLPACHLVALAYGLMLFAALSQQFWSRGLFFVGWGPVFLLAAGGSALELLGQDICPKTSGGWPKCFFSLGLAVGIILPVLVHWIFAKQSGDQRTH